MRATDRQQVARLLQPKNKIAVTKLGTINRSIIKRNVAENDNQKGDMFKMY